MKTRYAKKITKKDRRMWIIFILGGIALISIFHFTLSFHRPQQDIFLLIYIIVFPLISFYIPIAKISERNVLSANSNYIDIHKIISLEEDEKENIKVSFIFQGDSRSTSIPIHDKDKERLITDLLSINPNIEVKQQLSNAVI
ncbi:hypothetical protein AGMMS49574_11000 [Bacteroidia bacterium]|nr:hypothetical protein AGMMS49574_11000 [Bacteroidia bacterium]